MSLKLNGDLVKSVYGWDPDDVQAWWDAPSEQVDTFTPPGEHHVLRSATHTMQPMPWPLRLYLGLEFAASQRETKLDEIRKAFMQEADDVDTLRMGQDGEAAFQVGASTRKRYAIYRGDRVTTEESVDPILYGQTLLTLDLLCLDAAKYDEPKQIAFNDAEPKFVACGTLPSWWYFDVTDGEDIEVIVYADGGSEPGDELWRISLTGAVISGTTLRIDSVGHQLVLLGGSPDPDIVTNTYLPQDAGFFKKLGHRGGGVWVALTSGVGTLNARDRWR